MQAHATEEQVRAVCEKVQSLGYRAHPIPRATRTAIGITGNSGAVEPGTLDEMAGVQDVIRVSKPYKLVSRDVKEEDTVIRFPETDGCFGGRNLGIAAGPCSVESREQAFTIAERVARAGARFFRAGRLRKPVLLKRGMSATLEEFLMAAEYVLSEGNYEVILCERGVRTFADHTRNTLDLSIVPAVQKLSHLPIIVDPSHGTGKRDKVLPMSRAAVATGADGLLVEVHHDPDRALSDGAQSITCDQFDELVSEVRQIAQVVGRRVQEPLPQPVVAKAA